MSQRSRSLMAMSIYVLALAISGCGQPGGQSPGAAVEASAEALSNLTLGLKSRDPVVRERSAAAIARMGASAKEAVPALAAALKDRNLSVRAGAVYALGEIGAPAASALPELEAASKTNQLRDIAIKAITQIHAATNGP